MFDAVQKLLARMIERFHKFISVSSIFVSLISLIFLHSVAWRRLRQRFNL